MVQGGISVYTNQLSRLGIPRQTLKEGSQVLVRIISDKGGGKYEGSVAGARVTITSASQLKPGSTFTAAISAKNGQILLSPNQTLQNSFGQENIKLSLMQNDQLMSFLQNLGLPADSLSFHLLQQTKQLGMKFDASFLNKLHSLALKFNGKEKRAAELLMILSKKGLDFSEDELLLLLSELGWDAADQNQQQKNPSKNECLALRSLNSVKNSWQFFPYEIKQNQKTLAQGNTGLLFDDNNHLQLLNLECNWLSSAHRYLFSLEYKAGICMKIRMNCNGNTEENEKIAHKLDAVFSSKGKNITIEILPAEMLEGTACQTQEFYSFGGQV